MSQPRSVAFINNFSGPSLGGGEVQLLTLVKGLVREGAVSTIVCAEGSALEREARTIPGVVVVPERFDPVSVGPLVKRLANELRDVSIVQGTGFLTNNIARRVAKSTCAIVVNTVHVVPGAAKLDGEGAVSSIARKLLDCSAPSRVDRHVAVSRAVAEGLLAEDIDPHAITVIHNGVDVDALRAHAADDRESALPPGTPVIGFVGRLERVKGCEYFLRAAATLRDRYTQAVFVVGGSGSREAMLKELTESLGIASQVEFLGHTTNTAPLISALDVLVVPSLSEASGLSAIEALALGTPVVASAVGGLPEVLADGDCGLLVPAGDASAIAEAVSRLVEEPELAAGFVRAGQARVAEHFSAERMVGEYLALYGELVP